MANLLVVDDTTALTELFADAIRARLHHTVTMVHRLVDVGAALREDGPFDMALVDLSFPREEGSGLDALAEIHTSAPDTALAILTQGDQWVAQVLRDAWELLPIATVVSKTAPLQFQLDAIEEVLRTGAAPVDPVIQPLVPATKTPMRTIERFSALVQHAGHAKLWRALIAASDSPSYREVADEAGLRLNTVKNYRAQLVGELVLHGLHDPGLAEMREFALRCRPFLTPCIERALTRTG